MELLENGALQNQKALTDLQEERTLERDLVKMHLNSWIHPSAHRSYPQQDFSPLPYGPKRDTSEYSNRGLERGTDTEVRTDRGLQKLEVSRSLGGLPVPAKY